MKKRSTISWVLEFAGRKKSFYLGSVLLAVLGVAASFMPYLFIADMVGELLSGNKDFNYYLKMVIIMGVCWILRITLHSISTTLSHVATFNVLGGIRKQLCKKLSTIPLGAVLDDNSGTYKNIIVERVDSMETTLAHIVPEFTANILLPVVIFIYLLTIDWKVGLANLISAVIGLLFAAVMMAKSQGEFEVTVQKTKYLNDTAVEYINGIEVIKAFGKTGSSYEKFVVAAREGADCFIKWMRKCIWWQAGTLSFMPATFLGVLPIGLLLVQSGSLSAESFITCVILSAGLITPLVVAFSYMDDILKIGTIFGEVTEILERKDMEYLYTDGDLYYFMDNETYEQTPINKSVLGDNFKFVTENMVCKVLSYKGNVFGVEPPNFVELTVTQTDPGFKGDTATNVTKPATLETGAEIKVPLFINEGDKIQIDTRTGEYMSRA